MIARRLTAAAFALVAAIVALFLVLGVIEGFDREEERVTVSVRTMLLYQAVALASLAALVFTIVRAVGVWRGGDVATMILAFVGALIGCGLWFLILLAAFAS